MPSAPIRASASSCCRVIAAALDHGHALGVRGHVLELAAEPQIDVGMIVDRGRQRRLQVGAMHHPIGRAGAQCGGLAERQAGDLAAAPARS